jgi:hypothetical protein
LLAAWLLILLAPGLSYAQEPPHPPGAHMHRLGTVDFPNSGSAAAQEPFLRGIALLHSFEYSDAAAAFREAQKADSTFALAYWGEALTKTQLLWGVDDAAGAREVLTRLAPSAEARLARAGTPRERAYGAAVEAFFAEGEAAVRARAFADSLRGLAERNLEDLEASAFASLAIQMAAAAGAYPAEERAAAREGAVQLAERVFAASPDHPGAAHYLIHAYDDPVLAPRGLEAARAYASIAPDAEHALHMPSHIFVQVGDWIEAAASNERAWAASRAWVARRGVPATELDFHSLEWLHYAYLQLGHHRAATALVDSARAILTGVDTGAGTYPDARYVVSRMEFARAASIGDWAAWSMPAPDATSPASARARFFAMYDEYQRAAAAAMLGDPAPAEAAADRFRQRTEGAGAWTRFAALQLDALAARARRPRSGAGGSGVGRRGRGGTPPGGSTVLPADTRAVGRCTPRGRKAGGGGGRLRDRSGPAPQPLRSSAGPRAGARGRGRSGRGGPGLRPIVGELAGSRPRPPRTGRGPEPLARLSA